MKPFFLCTLNRLVCLLLHVRWQVIACVVDMDECSINNRYRFEYVLQAFTEYKVSASYIDEFLEIFIPQVMAIFECCTGVQYYVHLYVELITGMVGLETLDLLDGFRKTHCQIQY